VLADALETCRSKGATLAVSSVTRLARNLAFVSALMESDIRFVAVDMPDVDRFTLHVYAALAEEEARRLVQRVKAALGVAKARGVPLGWTMRALVNRQQQEARCFAEQLRGVVEQLAEEGLTSSPGVARWLNEQGICGPRGAAWSPSTAWRLQNRLAGTYRERRR
jgi:DNA invertase Pin-like site-specific DNA recombinase